MLAYIKGDKISLTINANNSSDHVDEFYQTLEIKGFQKPDFTVITHWHWDHTFGIHHIHDTSIAHHKTNEFLNVERRKLSSPEYTKFLKTDDECLRKEYSNGKKIIVVPSDIAFEKKLILNLAGITAIVFHAVSPHSEDTMLIYIPETKTLFIVSIVC